MLFWLKKALTAPFLPLNFTLLAGVIGVILLATKRQKLGRALVMAAVLALVVFPTKASPSSSSNRSRHAIGPSRPQPPRPVYG